MKKESEEEKTNSHEREGDNMAEEYRKLNKSKLKDRKRTTATTEESLKDIIPIQWTKSVITGTQKVSLSACK